jgi:hypothetical protein
MIDDDGGDMSIPKGSASRLLTRRHFMEAAAASGLAIGMAQFVPITADAMGGIDCNQPFPQDGYQACQCTVFGPLLGRVCLQWADNPPQCACYDRYGMYDKYNQSIFCSFADFGTSIACDCNGGVC